MHIITGLLLASLAGLKKKEKTEEKIKIPRFSTGPIQTAHLLPGRLRFRVPSLASDEMSRRIVTERFSKLQGVDSIEVRPVSGSVLIQYQKDEVAPEMLFAALVRLLDLEEELDKAPKPLITRELKAMGESLNRGIYEKTGGVIDLWTGLLILLAGYGVRKMIKDPARAFPAGFTLVWWGLNAVKRQE